MLTALLTGFIKVAEPGYMNEIAPIQLFRIDNTYSIHFRNIGGVTFVTWFALVLVGADGDTISRLFGWENTTPRLDTSTHQ